MRDPSLLTPVKSRRAQPRLNPRQMKQRHLHLQHPKGYHLQMVGQPDQVHLPTRKSSTSCSMNHFPTNDRSTSFRTTQPRLRLSRCLSRRPANSFFHHHGGTRGRTPCSNRRARVRSSVDTCNSSEHDVPPVHLRATGRIGIAGSPQYCRCRRSKSSWGGYRVHLLHDDVGEEHWTTPAGDLVRSPRPSPQSG